MNIFRTALFRAIALSLALPLSAVLVGCEIGSVDSTSAVLSDNEGTIYNYAGLYMSPSNVNGSTTGLAPLVYPHGAGYRPSGQLIVSLRLLQYGSVLEAYDSAGLTWYGSISSVQKGSATFSLRGRTTAGMSTEIAGTMTYVSQQSTMDASWIEPAYSGSLFAQATVTPAVTSSPPAKLVINPTSAALSTNANSQLFTVSGGTTPYSWSLSSSTLGSLSSSSGSSVTYTSAHIAGANTITVNDASSNSVTATATYTASGPTSLAISPSSLSLNATIFIGMFTASGGSGSYTWIVSNDSLGTVSPTTGSSVTYTSKKVVGTNSISVVDTEGHTATSTAKFQ
jgi:hypothetical protein